MCVILLIYVQHLSIRPKSGVTVKTLQRRDREGRLVARSTITNRWYYTDVDLAMVLGLSHTLKALEND